MKGAYSQIYAMESSCPHLGADMSHAEIEECDDSVIAVCPWHRYDFDLKTGESETGLRACTYTVQVRSSAGGDIVYVETPRGGTGWRLVELRPVSEEFADPPPPTNATISPSEVTATHTQMDDDESIVPMENPPRTLIQWAVLILNTPDPSLKVARTRHAVHLFRTAQLSSIGQHAKNVPKPPDTPPRHELYMKNTVEFGKAKAGKAGEEARVSGNGEMKVKGKGDGKMIGKNGSKSLPQGKGTKERVTMLHALANIEQWAIDLAWDIIARFGPSHSTLPPSFYSDFTKVALDEAKHFSLLRARLEALSPSTPYGSLPVHAGLWDSAWVTRGSLLSRLAIIHLVHEARGSDVNPKTIEKFRRAGDRESVDVMDIVHRDEVTHVCAGHRWFVWICEREASDPPVEGKEPWTGKGIDPVQRFREEVRKYWRGEVKGPFNVEDREKAGLGREFYEDLRGELGAGFTERVVRTSREDGNGEVEAVGERLAGMKVGYEV
ncbi:hypothetical protein JAAARDRAFT_211793 [Jaapia argillacea MUCL 33604]|uniref:Rieske domain-containing protein n=1 Tax=Jaapia argillacea MUCL 33604 TaxID=933084 RepID=A0A067P675_9AGAM|nr:hypothetical protein JAAARDRAFT_211793 [Jaapia argillacea MUCL 33604]